MLDKMIDGLTPEKSSPKPLGFILWGSMQILENFMAVIEIPCHVCYVCTLWVYGCGSNYFGVLDQDTILMLW